MSGANVFGWFAPRSGLRLFSLLCAAHAVCAGPPAIVSLTPDSGTGTLVTFQAVYSDPSGASDLNEILLQVNTTQSSADACYVYYQPKGNHLYLANDAGTAWMTPALTPGTAGTVSNSQCTLDAGSSSFSTPGNDLTLNIALTFNSMVIGTRNVYLYAGGLSGLNSGWVKEGTWTPATSGGPPAIVSLLPNTGGGSSVTFQAIYSDPNGAGDLSETLLQINTTQTSANACYVYYQPKGNHLYLANDAGNIWMTPALTPGVAGTASNSQCTLNAGLSSVATAGNDLTLNVALTFNSAVVGSRNVYLYTAERSGQNSGWVTKGTWTPSASAGPPSIVSLTPNAGAGTSVTFQAVYADPNGASDLSQVMLLVNNSINSANACFVYYQPQGNHLYLASDVANAWITPAVTPGVSGTVSNSQCTLNAGSSSVTTAGNDLTLNVALTFSSAFFGADKNMYLYAAGLSGQNSGWVKEGTAGPPAIVSLSPNTGSGKSVTFQAVYSDPEGAADLSALQLEVNASQSNTNACYVYYQPQGNHLYLADNTGVWITPALTPGVAGTASNSQCTLNAGSSSVGTAGNAMTLSVALSFSSTFPGTNNVYLYAAGLSGQNSGWVTKGTLTPNQNLGPPAVVSLTPNAGSGKSVTFQAVYSDPYGTADLNELQLEMNAGQSSANACYVYYQPQGNHLYLADNAGTWITPALTPGVAGMASNNQCTLNAASSSVSTVGNAMTLNFALSFSSTFTDLKYVFLYAAGMNGRNSGWVTEGTWTPNLSVGPPAIVSLSPNAGGGTSVTFQSVYSDPNGAGDIQGAFLLVNNSLSNFHACSVWYSAQANLLYLASDNAMNWTPALTPGVAGTASNSQCTLNAASSSASTAGKNLTLNVALNFSSTFAGSQNVYLEVAGVNSGSTGWLKEGWWMSSPIGPPVIVSLSPASAGGKSVTFQATYSAADLSELQLLVNASQSSANACYVSYEPQGNQLYLADNAGAWITPALTPGVAGTASSSQCTLNAGSSSVSTAGNNLTLNVALTFSSTFLGTNNVYLYAAGLNGQNSGWVKEGTWLLTAPTTITVRSGNGAVGGSDALIHFLLGPSAGDFDHLFTASDFSAAQTGPAAFIVSPAPYWISSLPADPSAKWIGTNANAVPPLGAGNTALYAVSFTVPAAFSSATLVLNFAVKDWIGESASGVTNFNTGVYLNGAAICGSSIFGSFDEIGIGGEVANCGDVTSSLIAGVNWLYIEDWNWSGPAGLLFSATFTTAAPGTN